MYNNINNVYNTKSFINSNYISNCKNNNNLLLNILNPNFNNINNYNYNICNYNKHILESYQNNIYFSMKDKYNPFIYEYGVNNIKLNKIYSNNIDNNNCNNNNICNNNYLNIIRNNLMEKGNLNKKILNNINYNTKENKNLNITIINKDKNSDKLINLNDNFMQYINHLPIPLVDYLCTSRGISEIKKKLPQSNYEYKKIIILYLNKNGLTKIMKNVYGNYFFQQLIKDSEEHIISLILFYISDNFIDISKDSSGTFSLQALLDEISTLENEIKILKFIKHHEMEIAYDKNATYVLQKLLLIIPDTRRKELNEIILNNIKELCLDSNGICLIKNFIRTNTLINDKKRINDEFVKNFLLLAESPFGNYGIQYLIENWDNDILNDLKDKIMENIHKLSIQQYSSNVVEKAIEIIDGEFRTKIIQKLCFEGHLMTLIKNKFGRFVLYKAINYMNNGLKNELEKEIINIINNKNYHNKDKIKIKKFFVKIKHRQM